MVDGFQLHAILRTLCARLSPTVEQCDSSECEDGRVVERDVFGDVTSQERCEKCYGSGFVFGGDQ